MARILIVEDDSVTQKIYLDKLKKEGYDVEIAATGNEGLTIAFKKAPDLIILDIMLREKLNGFDVLEELKKRPETKNIPVLILSNLGGEEKVAKEIGAVEYLIKANTSLEEIINKVKNLLDAQKVQPQVN